MKAKLIKRNIFLFYVLSIIQGAFFIESNWIFLYLVYFNYEMLGFIDSIAFSIGLLLEIPSGAIADVIGRKKTLIIAMFFLSFGLFMEFLAQDSIALFIGNILFFIGNAFYSGSIEALTFDTLVLKKEEKDYEKVVSLGRSLGSISTIIAVLIGGFLATINIRYPFLLMGNFYAIGFILSFALTEPPIDSVKVTVKAYFEVIKNSIKELKLPSIKPYIFFIISILGITYWYDWGMVKPAISVNLGYDTQQMGLIFSLSYLLIALLTPTIPKLRKLINDYSAISILNFLLVLTLFILGLNLGSWGFIPILIIGVIGAMTSTWIGIIINEKIQSQNRATVLSTVSMLLKIPYILTAWISGYLIDKGFLPQVLFGLAFIVGIFSFINLLKRQELFKEKINKA